MSNAADRLAAELEEKDGEIAELEEKLRQLQFQLDYGPGWALPSDEKHDARYPLPRLEMRFSPSRDGDWGSTVVRYGMLRRHLCDHVIFAPMGRTKLDGSRGKTDVERDAKGIPHLPYRDGAHLAFDSTFLDLPVFVRVQDEEPAELSAAWLDENYPHQRELGRKARLADGGRR